MDGIRYGSVEKILTGVLILKKICMTNLVGDGLALVARGFRRMASTTLTAVNAPPFKLDLVAISDWTCRLQHHRLVVVEAFVRTFFSGNFFVPYWLPSYVASSESIWSDVALVAEQNDSLAHVPVRDHLARDGEDVDDGIELKVLHILKNE